MFVTLTSVAHEPEEIFIAVASIVSITTFRSNATRVTTTGNAFDVSESPQQVLAIIARAGRAPLFTASDINQD